MDEHKAFNIHFEFLFSLDFHIRKTYALCRFKKVCLFIGVHPLFLPNPRAAFIPGGSSILRSRVEEYTYYTVIQGAYLKNTL